MLFCMLPIYFESLAKRKDSLLSSEKTKSSVLETLGLIMVSFSASLPNECGYGMQLQDRIHN